MEVIPVKSSFESFLNELISKVQYRPRLTPLHLQLQNSLNQLNRPIRVAFIGSIKAGKSTLVNSLLGESIVPVGDMENTFNVSWLKYSEEKYAEIHYKDGRNTKIAIDEMEKYVARDMSRLEELTSIKYVVIYLPYKWLKKIEIIDTPGFGSVYEGDSENTARMLLRHKDELSQTTQHFANLCDAVLCLFRNNMPQDVKEILVQRKEDGNYSPLNTLGVLTRIDQPWNKYENPEPLFRAYETASLTIKRHTTLLNLLHDIVPVNGLLGLAGQTLSEQEFSILCDLAQYPTSSIERAMANEDRIKNKVLEYLPIAPELRRPIIEQLGMYGTWISIEFIRNNSEVLLPEFKKYLLLKSGFLKLKERIFAHFGNRAYLLKILNDLGILRSICYSLRNKLERPDLIVLTKVEDQIDKYLSSNFAFTELTILTEYYRLNDAEKISILHLTESQLEEFLHAMGERGSSVSSKLGIHEPSEYIDLIEITKEKIRKWKALSNGATSISNITKQIAETTVRSYEFILQQLNNPS